MASSYSRSTSYMSSGGSVMNSSRSSRMSVSSSRMSTARSGSVYGGAGGSGIRISTASSGGFNMSDDTNIIGNEKGTMQSLNDRLATYLTKVRALEKANADLELKIQQFLDNKLTPSARDYSAYYATIKDLQDKIMAEINLKGGIHLSIDNTSLAVNDFKMKYEAEHAMRQSVEADIIGLKQVLQDFDMTIKDLSVQIEGLKEELVFMKKNHEEDLLAARSQMSGQVNVEVDAPQQDNLTMVLHELREHYEAVTAKNQRELDEWFKTKTESLKEVVVISTTDLKSSRSEINTLKSRVQALEVELQALLSLKSSLEATLTETKSRYSLKLSGFQSQVTFLESQITQIRLDCDRQSQEYQILLDIKARLEMEITEYRRLLDGEVAIKTTSSTTNVTSTTSRTKVITVMEKVEDGKTVSSSSTSSFSSSRIN
ncbi:Keratin, type I cytoskeletal 50 kDa GK50 [Triplophysa tibetana]|uniref:Keratin, type I cytoskeletal 50 kDa GK50 n=1 Tax=Triplophysa tibetana TaxID=1572043 RepID=A0A5A9NM27_9TELE|nr:Keratin, type I cytoskeletal 50 kDa GK50 [Triplophysa tibetana]